MKKVLSINFENCIVEESNMAKTTIAIIGTGVVGERIINQALASANYEITSIFDENKERLNEMATKYNLEVAVNVEELLNTRPDWVYIGTPPVSHAPLAELIAAHGLNILSEKPLAHDAQDGQKMVEAAAKANVQTAMHFPMMYSPAVNRLKQELAAGTLGEIKRIELHTYFPHWPRKWQQNPWIASREQGGFIREIFPHYLQVLHHLFGDLNINAHQTTYPEDEKLCETGVSALGTTVSGIPVVLNAVAGIGQEERIDFKVFGAEQVMTVRNWSELWVAQKDEAFVQISPDVTPVGLLEACHNLLQGQESLVVDFEEGLKIQKWIDKLLK